MIVVLDTNVFISALLKPSSVPDLLLQAVLDGRLEVVFSPHLQAELERALQYEQVHKRLLRFWSDEDLRAFVTGLFRLARQVPNVTPSEPWVASDPDDNWVVQCAVSGSAERIATGDRALLELRAVAGIRVVTPAQLLNELRTSAN